MRGARVVRFYCGLMAGSDPVDKQVYLNVMDAFFTGYTVFETAGRWEGASEPSIVIEVITGADEGYVAAAAKALRVVGRQEAVLVTETALGDSMLITD